MTSRRMTGRVVVVGALLVEVLTHVDEHPRDGETVQGNAGGRFAAGKGGNQALAARREGAEVSVVAAVGDDDNGRAYVQRLERHGIRCLVQVRRDQPTATRHVVRSPDTERTVEVAGAAHLRGVVDLGLAPGDVLLCSLDVPAPVVVEACVQAEAAGARAVVNLAPYAALPHEVVALADPLVVNERGMQVLADSDMVPASLLVTFGPAGARWGVEQVDGIRLPETEAVDPVGAGDAFCGALAAALARGDDPRTALEAANRAGAAAVRWRGAQPDAAL